MDHLDVDKFIREYDCGPQDSDTVKTFEVPKVSDTVKTFKKLKVSDTVKTFEKLKVSDTVKTFEVPKVFDLEIVKKKFDETYRSIRQFQRTSVNKDFKSSKKALEFTRKGNTMFKEGLLQRASISYTKALAFAPKNGLEMGCAYASRSEVFFADRWYYHSLLDANRSLECDIPEGLRGDIMARKEQCIDRVRKDLLDRGQVEDSDLNLDAVDPLEMKLNLDAVDPFEMKLRGKGRYDPYPIDDEEDTGEVPKVLLRMYIEATITVNQYTDSAPTMEMAASGDIKEGGFICIEKIIGAALDEASFPTHCDYCLGKCFNMIPCPTCTKVLYCSTKCCESALELYHGVECKVINFYGSTKMEWLAFRTFLAGTLQGKKLSELMGSLKEEEIFKPTGDLVLNTSNRLLNSYIYTLWRCGQHFSEAMLAWRTTRDDTVSWVIKAIIVLQEAGFFEGEHSRRDRLTEKEQYAALLLLNNFISVGRRKPITPAQKKLGKRDPAFNYVVTCWQDMLQSDKPPNTNALYVDRFRILCASRKISANEQVTYS